MLGLLGVRDGVVAVTRADLADPAPAAAAVRGRWWRPGPRWSRSARPAGAGCRSCARRSTAWPPGSPPPRRRAGAAVRGPGVHGRGRRDRGDGHPLGRAGRAGRPGDGAARPARAGGCGRRRRTTRRPSAPTAGGWPSRSRACRATTPRAGRAWCATTTGGAPADRLGAAHSLARRGRRRPAPTGAACSCSSAPPRCPPRARRSTRRGCRPARPGLVALRLERPVPARPATGWCCGRAAAPWAAGRWSTPARRAARAGADRAARLRVLADGRPAERDALRLRDAGPRGPGPGGAGGRGGGGARRARVRPGGGGGRRGRRSPRRPPAARRRRRRAPRAASRGRGGRARRGTGRRGARVRAPRRRPGPGAGGARPAARGRRPAPAHPGQLGEEAGLSPADLRAALGRLRAAGRAAPAGDLWFACAALDEAAARARVALAERPLGVAELRDLWGVGRRGALAIAGPPRRARAHRPPGGRAYPAPRGAAGAWWPASSSKRGGAGGPRPVGSIPTPLRRTPVTMGTACKHACHRVRGMR